MATKWAEYKRKQRERAKEKNLDLGKEESVVESTLPGNKMAEGVHPMYPQLRRWADREYDENGLVLKEQRCGLCNRTWSASIAIECPYCHGKGIKTI